MGAFAPVFLAFILNCFGITIYREFKPPTNAPLLSYITFHISVFFLLWDIRLYPRGLRKLWKCGEYLTTFLFAAFLIEHIMSDFWVPISTSITAYSGGFGDLGEEYNEIPVVGLVVEILKGDSLGILVNHLFSLFFLIAILHATRIIDLRDMEFGMGCFLKKTGKHFSKAARRVMSHISFNRQDDLCGEFISNEKCNEEECKLDSKYYFDDNDDSSCEESMPNLSDATEECSDFEYEPPIGFNSKRK